MGFGKGCRRAWRLEAFVTAEGGLGGLRLWLRLEADLGFGRLIFWLRLKDVLEDGGFLKFEA